MDIPTEVIPYLDETRLYGGALVGVRLNLNLRKKTGHPILTVHEGTSGRRNRGFYDSPVLGYVWTATLKDVRFSVNGAARDQIASGAAKFPMASVDGTLVLDSFSDEGIEVRFNPAVNDHFVTADGRAILAADEATLLGSRVFVRGNILTAEDGWVKVT